jgi:DNA-binding GntR family transcriptional regulator
MSPVPVRPLTREARLAVEEATAWHLAFKSKEAELDELRTKRRELVEKAAAAGATYQAIGDALRMPRQSAYKITHPTPTQAEAEP